MIILGYNDGFDEVKNCLSSVGESVVAESLRCCFRCSSCGRGLRSIVVGQKCVCGNRQFNFVLNNY